MLVEQCLPRKNDDELDEAEDPEENAGKDHALLRILILLVFLTVASRDGGTNVIRPCLKDDGYCDHLKDQAEELCLLHDARIIFHF